MAVSSDEIESILRKQLPEAQIKIADMVGDSDHYSLEIADKSFSGKSLITQHKIVKDALKELLQSRLHAITIKTYSLLE